MPFLDLRRERRLSRRPVAVIAFILVVLSMGTLTWKGATAKESSGGDANAWKADLGLAAKDMPGATLVATSGCLNCHTLDGQGSSNLGAPDLTAIGTTNSDPKFFSDYVANPRKFGNPIMPVFASLGKEKLDQIGVFLADAKGPK
jgi:cbb3-type cytochrome oxidase cytochrome c subunit